MDFLQFGFFAKLWLVLILKNDTSVVSDDFNYEYESSKFEVNEKILLKLRKKINIFFCEGKWFLHFFIDSEIQT